MDISKHDTPAALLLVQDLTERLPAERERILRHEINWREREQMQFRGIRRVMHLHAWMSFRTVIFVGITVFIFVFTLGQFAGLARWVQTVRNTALSVSQPIQAGLGLSPESFVPSSTLLHYAAQIPVLGLWDAGLLALIVVIALVLWKGYNTYFLLLQARGLRRAQRELQEEIDILRSWLSEVDQARKTG